MSLSKEAAIYLATNGMRNPSQGDWKNAIQLIAQKKGKKLDAQQFGAAVMEAQYDFIDGISDEFLAREILDQEKEKDGGTANRK